MKVALLLPLLLAVSALARPAEPEKSVQQADLLEDQVVQLPEESVQQAEHLEDQVVQLPEESVQQAEHLEDQVVQLPEESVQQAEHLEDQVVQLPEESVQQAEHLEDQEVQLPEEVQPAPGAEGALLVRERRSPQKNKEPRGTITGGIHREKGVGTVVHAQGEGNVWKSKNGNARVDAHGDWSKVVNGPGRGKPNYNVGIKFTGRF